MGGTELLREARLAAGLSQEELAQRVGTSRTTLSAYEHGRKSPTLATAARVLDGAGCELAVVPRVRFHRHLVGRGRSVWVPDLLARLPVEVAFRQVVLPVRLNWSRPGQRFRLRDRGERARCYEVVLREGEPGDIAATVDGALLVDLWEELVLPQGVRAVWDLVIDAMLGSATGEGLGA